VVGILSGASPLKRALRQLAIGYSAAAATYLLGRAFGAILG
jgi:VIT1/CCC1 family predicted Fe2+/Mn2+ transporter